MNKTNQKRSRAVAIGILLACIAGGTSGAFSFDDLQVAPADPTAKAPPTRPVVPASPIVPADRRSVPEARHILAYLYSLPSKRERRLLTGQFIGHGDYLSLGEIDEIQKRSGQRVALLSNDYGLGHMTSTKGNSALIAHWKAGGLVMVSHHALNPKTMAFGSISSRDVAPEDVLNPETETGKNWLADMKNVADGLGELQKAGVVVLWRPFHEMNKDYFWWGLRDRAWFKRLWRRQFELFTKTYGLHNLLWVYSPYQAADAATYYPGDDVVDVVGLDAYETHLERIQGYDAMVAL